VAHLIWPGPFPRRIREGTPYHIESVRAYYQLSEIYFLYNKPLPLIYALLTTLNLAERLEPSSELSWALAGVGNVVGLIPVHSLANRYIARAKGVADDLHNPYDQAYVRLVASLYTSGFGYSMATQQDLETALEIFQKAGDRRRMGETLATLAILVGFQGDLDRCASIYGQLLSMAVKRGNELFQAWALVGLAELDLIRGEFESAVGKLEAALQLLEENIDRSEEIRAIGLLAKAYLLSGSVGRALELAAAGYQLITQSLPPTVFSMVVGYSGVAEVYLRLWEMQLADPHILDQSTSELRRSAKRAMVTLGSFSRVFKAGLPYKLLWMGVYAWLGGSQAKALKNWRAGLAVAEAVEMPYEQGLLHFEIARHLETGHPQRAGHIQAAQDIFSRLGASANIARLNEFIDQG
jgi:tetratricopeptide (TPR) repeat protein